MALAWKAGWVNSPQGFESPILRQICVVLHDRGLGHQHTPFKGFEPPVPAS
jgi:hypothetical protein